MNFIIFKAHLFKSVALNSIQLGLIRFGHKIIFGTSEKKVTLVLRNNAWK